LAGVAETAQLPDSVLHDRFLPRATTGWAFVVALCGLAETEVLNDQVVDPLLSEAARL